MNNSDNEKKVMKLVVVTSAIGVTIGMGIIKLAGKAALKTVEAFLGL